MTTYYVYSAEGKHDFLGTLKVPDDKADDINFVFNKAQKSYRVANIRVDSTRKVFRPPTGRRRVAPDLVRRVRPDQSAAYSR